MIWTRGTWQGHVANLGTVVGRSLGIHRWKLAMLGKYHQDKCHQDRGQVELRPLWVCGAGTRSKEFMLLRQ